MQGYQFVHYNPQFKIERFKKIYQKKTFCIEIPDGVALNESLSRGLLFGREAEISLEFGMAKCHPDDQFVKSVGREIAMANLESRTFKVTSLNIMDKELRYVLVGGGVVVICVVNRKTNNVKIFSIQDNGDSDWSVYID